MIKSFEEFSFSGKVKGRVGKGKVVVCSGAKGYIRGKGEGQINHSQGCLGGRDLCKWGPK